MREIKFRSWANGSMWNVNALACSDGSDSMDLIDDSIGGYAKVSDFDDVESRILMQYTGLKDKNGKEIYEGDVLRLSDKEYEVNFRRNVQVKWSSGGWWYVEVRNDDGMSIDTLFVGYCHDDSEVIGNIYEKPDLCCMGCEECIPEEDHP